MLRNGLARAALHMRACARFACASARGGASEGRARAAPRGMATYVDVGANLTDGMFRGVYRGKRAHEDDLGAVLRRAREAGVSDIIVTAGTLEEAREAVALARETREDGAAPRLYATCGVHPTRCGAFADDVDGADAHLEKLKRVALDGKASGTIVAIGEMGLDYDRLEFCDAATQKEMFEKQFALAEATSLPLFLHMRAACDDFLEIIDRNAHRFTAGVVHSFTGGAREAAAVLARENLLIGLNGCSLKTQENLDVVKTIPLDRIVLETDAPWCGIKPTHAGFAAVAPPLSWPKPVKKEKWFAGALIKDRCEPAHIVCVAQIIACAHGVGVDVVAEACARNARRVFCIDKSHYPTVGS